MGVSIVGKRAFLKAAGALAALGAAGRARAQDLRLFGLDIPDEITGLLPAKPIQYVKLAEALITL